MPAIATTRAQLGFVNALLGNLPDAITALTLAAEQLLQLKMYTLLLQVYRTLSDTYGELDNFRDAHRYKELHRQLSLQRASPEVRYRSTSTRVLLSLQQYEQQREIERLQRDSLIRDLHNTTTALLAQTELLANFRDEIRAAVRKLPPTEPVVKELKEKLKALPCESVDWERFDAQFKAAHPEFVKNLTTTHADLTSMEVRICSLLRSSLKSQDIGRLLCLSDRTVENHRFNIRKKLALARSVDLKVYLQRF